MGQVSIDQEDTSCILQEEVAFAYTATLSVEALHAWFCPHPLFGGFRTAGGGAGLLKVENRAELWGGRNTLCLGSVVYWCHVMFRMWRFDGFRCSLAEKTFLVLGSPLTLDDVIYLLCVLLRHLMFTT